MARMIVCSDCSCHVKAREPRCPHCGARLLRSDGTPLRAAAALALGLTTAALASGACSDTRTIADDDDGTSSTSTAMPAYGVPDVTSVGGMGGSGASGGFGGIGGSGGAGTGASGGFGGIGGGGG